MNALPLSLRRSTHALACLGLATTAAQLVAAGPADPPDPFETFNSYIKLSGFVPDASGNDAAYAQRARTNADGAVGIEAMRIETDIDPKTTFVFDGRALFGANDYLAKATIARTDVGTLDFGYKSFGTFYDGIGGFFPLNSYWQPLTKEQLHTDRGSLWADLKITLPNAPVLRLRFSEERRTGQKDSTIWGDTDFTGIPIWSQSSLNPYSANRKLVPSYIDLDELQRTYEASLSHTFGKTTVDFSIIRTEIDNNDTRWLNRYPGEIRPYPAIPSTPATLVTADKANNPVYGFDRQSAATTTMAYTGKFETVFNDKVTLFGGLSYQQIDAEIGGAREMTTDIMTGSGRVSVVGGFSPSTSASSGPGRPPYSYRMVDGDATESILTGNLGVKLQPAKDLFVSCALKGESSDTDGHNQINFINTKVVLSSGARTDVPVSVLNYSKRSETAWTPEINVRYSGIKNLSLYGSFDYRHVSGDENAINGGLGSTGTGSAGTWIAGTPATAEDNTGEKHGHYKVGANWNLCSAATLRAEVFYRDHKNSFTDIANSIDGYVLGYRYHGVRLTGIIKPLPGLTFTSRYVGQIGKADVAIDSEESYDSMDSTNHSFGETIDWAPTKQLYFQANFNVVFATIETAYPRAGGTANDVLRNADNNYWNGSFISGLAVGEKTNVELQATMYRADNYQSSMVVSTPYGAEVRESSIVLAVKHRFTEKIRGTIKVGYFEHDNTTTGGFTNFHGPMAYLAIEHAL